MTERLIQLGLFKRRNSDKLSFPVRIGRLLARLFGQVADAGVESESLKTAEFQSKLERYRVHLGQVTDIASLESALEKGVALCDDYLSRSRDYLEERDREIWGIVAVLREAVTAISGHASDFHQRLLDSSVRFQRLHEIEDIRQLKRQITEEVNQFTQIMADKGEQEQNLYAKMEQRFEALQGKLRQSKQQGLLDPLTQTGNRRGIERALRRMLLQSLDKPFMLAMLDIDNFKHINDSYGHQVGDQALVSLSKWISSHIRSGDFVGRYGGDEFVVIMADTALHQAEIRFLQLLAFIAATPLEFPDGAEARKILMTVSCGLTESIPGEASETLLRRADKALYEAKQRGKNCLVTDKAL